MKPASLLALLNPPLCVACRDPAPGGGPLCGPCLGFLNSADEVWGDPPPGLDDCVAAFDHDGVARKLVHALKFARMEPLVPLMAGYMCEHLGPPDPGTVVVPVPAVRLRTALRGFDPAQLLARDVASATGAGLETRSIRRHGIGRQRGGGRDQRIGSPPDIRPATGPDPPSLEGRPVVLVDDVITTGATVSACARVLRGIGAGPVSGLSFTRRI